MEPKGWRNWKEIPYRGQPEPKSYKSNRSVKFSKLEKRINILSIIFLGLLTLTAIFFALKNYHNHNTDNMVAFIILSITGLLFTISISIGVLSGTRRKRKSRIKKNK